MTDFECFLNPEERELAGGPAYARFANPHIVGSLAEAAMAQVEPGISDNACFVPVVNYGMEYALRGLKLPSVRARLPQEVTERARVAENIAKFAAIEGVQNNIFAKVYLNNPILRQAVKVYPERFNDAMYLASFFKSPFFEVSQTAGGAFAALEDHGIPTAQRTEILASSRGLQVIARIPANTRATINGWLGKPYAHAGHFDVHHRESVTTVTFNARTLKLLGKLMLDERVCPAAKVRLPAWKGNSLLQRSFDDIVRTLFYGDPVVSR